MRTFEDFGPLIGSLCATAILWFVGASLGDTFAALRELAASAFTLSGIFLGFLLTIISVVSTVTSRRMKFVKDSGNYPRLMNYLNRAIYLNIIVVTVSFGLTIFKSLLINVSWYAFIALAFAVTYALLASVRFSFIFTMLLSDPKGE